MRAELDCTKVGSRTIQFGKPVLYRVPASRVVDRTRPGVMPERNISADSFVVIPPHSMLKSVRATNKTANAVNGGIRFGTTVGGADVIATLAKQAESHGWNTMISTIDKDIMQLVNPRIKIMNDMTKTELMKLLS